MEKEQEPVLEPEPEQELEQPAEPVYSKTNED